MGLFKRRDRHVADSNTNNGSIACDKTTTSSRHNFAMKRATSNLAHTASLPHVPLPRAPDPQADPAAYLRSIYAVRDRSKLVLDKAKRNQLRHFNVDMSKFSDTAAYVVSMIKVCCCKRHTPCPCREAEFFLR